MRRAAASASQPSPPTPRPCASFHAPTVVPVVAPPAVAAPATPAVAYLVLPNRKVFMYPELTTPRLDSDGYLCAVCIDRLLFKDDNSLHSEDEATFSWSVSVQLMVFHADLASSQLMGGHEPAGLRRGAVRRPAVRAPPCRHAVMDFSDISSNWYDMLGGSVTYVVSCRVAGQRRRRGSSRVGVKMAGASTSTVVQLHIFFCAGDSVFPSAKRS